MFSDKKVYPNFVRLNAPDSLLHTVAAAVLHYLNFTTFDVWWCAVGNTAEFISSTTEGYTSQGLRVSNLLLRPFDYTACVPGSQQELDVMANEPESFKQALQRKKRELDTNINASLDFNAHAHLNALTGDCAIADIMYYLEMKGLVGSGHLWIDFVIWRWLRLLPIYVYTVVTVNPNPFAYGKPFDGAIILQHSENESASLRYREFQRLIKFIGQWQEDYLDPWIQRKLPIEAFDNLDSSLWYDIQQSFILFDSIGAILFATNKCVLKYGLGFTGQQLRGEILKLDVGGLGSQVVFDDNGDRLTTLSIVNVRYPSSYVNQVSVQGASYSDVVAIVSAIERVPVGAYRTQLDLYEKLVFYGNSSLVPSNDDRSCPLGQRYERVSGNCLICPIGTYTSREGMQFCEACPAGMYTSTSGSTVCRPCREGMFTESSGATACVLCAAGLHADAVQMSFCKACWPGSFSKVGSSICTLCPRGTYTSNKGSVQCTPCMGDKTTENIGSTSAIGCGCREGTWFYLASPFAQGLCVSSYCAESLECPGGNSEPMQGQGFHVGRPSYEYGMPSFFVLCASPRNCPRGRELGVCPAHREGMACDLCEVGFSDDGNGGCARCTGASAGILASLATVAGLVAPVQCFFHLRQATVFSTTSATLALIVPMGINALQIASAISRVEIKWIEPMASLRDGLRLLCFDPAVLKIQCASTTNSPAVLYLLGLLAFPTYALYLCSLLLVARWFWRKQVAGNCVVNAVGGAMLTFNTGLALQVARAWQCVLNPDGTTSMASARSVTCYASDGHRAILGMSVAGALAYLVAPSVLTLWVVVRLPYKIVKPGGLDFFERYRFLIARFRPEQSWYCMIFMSKSLLCALLPAFLVNEPQLLLMVFFVLIVATLSIQYRACPWRTPVLNHLDAGSSIGLLWFVFAGSILLPTPDRSGQAILQACMMAVCIVFLVAFGSILLSKLWRRLFPRKVYGVFLSHHKGAAAVLSRWFKLLFQASTNILVFLDSDELDDLSLLFNVVAWETDNFVLLWTSQTVLRSWCAGEIASALERKINTIVVLCDQVPPLTDRFIEEVGSSWTVTEIKSLADLGITVEMIRRSYVVLRSLPLMLFNRNGSEADQEASFSLIFGSCRGMGFAGTKSNYWWSHKLSFLRSSVRRPTAQAEASSLGSDGIAIVADMRVAETRTVCYVLRIMLQKQMHAMINVVGEAPQQSVEELSAAKNLLVVLTRDCLVAPSIAKCLLKSIEYTQLLVIPVNADKTFEFPGADFWVTLKTRWGNFNSLDFQGVNFDSISFDSVLIAYQSMLMLLALTFSPYASQIILEAEILQMVNRLTAAKRVGAGNSMASVVPQAAPPAMSAAPLAATTSVPQLVLDVDGSEVEILNVFSAFNRVSL